MLDSIYEWLRNLASYLVLVTVVLEVLPGKEYKKYIRFFTGLTLILLCITPLLKISGTDRRFTTLYHGYEYEQIKKAAQEEKERIQKAEILDFLPEEYPRAEKEKPNGNIKVEEIKIGE